MGSVITTLIAQIATWASILGLYFTLQPPGVERPWWHWFLIAFSICMAVFLFCREIVAYTRTAPRRYRSVKKINAYMRRWVSSGGRVVIFSRDMSWADDAATRSVLKQKAKRNELTVCLEHPIPLTDDLGQDGATIILYGDLVHVPRSRFTIIDFGREGARVAVGVRSGNAHVIQEFQSGVHPFFAVAEDLVKFLVAYNDLKRHVT